MGDLSQGSGDEVLAGRLAEASRLLGELDLRPAEAERLQRQFIAVCDAIKAPGADVDTGLRRLTAFLATLEQVAAKCRGNKSHIDKSLP
jgi:hypothetical protein